MSLDENASQASCQQLAGGKSHKKPTRKQKKAAAHRKRLDAHDLPFCDVSDVTSTVDNLPARDINRHSSGGQMGGFRSVPPLMTLCLQKVQSMPLHVKEKLPSSVQTLVRKHQEWKRMKQCQIEWAENLLKWIESEKPGLLPFKQEEKHSGVEFIPHSRSLWECTCTSDDTRHAQRCTEVHTLARYRMSSSSSIEQGHCHAVLCRLVDLLLPPLAHCHVGCNKLKTVDSGILQESKTAEIKVKIYILKRFPKMRPLLQHVMPYVWWARGAVDLAEDALLQLIQKCSGDVRSLYCNELGRLYMWTGEPTLAIQAFQQSADCSRVAVGEKAGVVALVLSANVWNQQLGKAHSPDHALSMWGTALHTADTKCLPYVAMAALDSMLSFHLAYYAEDRGGMESLQRHLGLAKGLVRQLPQLIYHVALILALLGQTADSNTACSELRRRHHLAFNGLDTDSMSSVLVGDRHRKVDIMKVLWRTQLVHPSLAKHGKRAAVDVSVGDPHFTLSEHGFLTGDLKMCLPPVYDVTIRPDNGQIQFPSKVVEGYESFECMQRQDMFQPINAESLRPPHVTRVYDNEGVSVDMFLHQTVEGHCKTLTLTRREAGASTVLKLKPAIRDAYEKIYTAETLEEFDRSMAVQPRRRHKLRRNAVLWRDVCLFVIQKYFRNNQFPTAKYVDTVAGHIVGVHQGDQGATCEDCRQGGAIRKQWRSQAVILSGLKVCGTAVAFLFNAETLLFVRCESVEIFQSSPRVVYASPWPLGELTPCQATRWDLDPPAPVLQEGVWRERGTDYISQFMAVTQHLNMGSAVDFLAFFDDRGNIVDHDIWTREAGIWNPCTAIGPTRFGFTPNRDRVVAMDSIRSRLSSPGLRGHMTALERLTAHFLILVTSRGLCVIRAEDLEPVKLALAGDDRAVVELPFSSDNIYVEGAFSVLKLLAVENGGQRSEFGQRSEVGQKPRAAVGLDEWLIVLSLPEAGGQGQKSIDSMTVTIELCRRVVGFPREVTFVSRNVGMVVTTSVFPENQDWARDMLLQLDNRGNVLRVLPLLGPGNHALTPMYFTSDMIEKHNLHITSGWYLFFNDNLGGICSSRLELQ